MNDHEEIQNHEQRIERIEGLLEQDPMKSAVKAALKEWLDEKFAEVGKWTVHGIVAAGLVALAYFILTWHGWKHTP